MVTTIAGTVVSVMVGQDPDSIVSTHIPSVGVTYEGFEGDRHAGLTRSADVRAKRYPSGTRVRNTRQVSLASEEELAEIAASLGIAKIRPEWLGSNLMVRGIASLTALPPSTRLYFASGATLVVDAENRPCTGPGEVIEERYPAAAGIASAFPKAALHKRGLVAWVEREGRISVGDEVEAELPETLPYPD